MGPVLVGGETVAIVLVEAIQRAEPEETLPILKHTKDKIIREAMFDGQVLELERSLGANRPGQHHQPEQEEEINTSERVLHTWGNVKLSLLIRHLAK